MLFKFITPISLLALLGILFYVWWKGLIKEKEEKVRVFFFVCNAQDYFEGLVWDLRRISNWRGKDVVIYVTDVGSTDDTGHIVRLLVEKGFIQQLTPRQATKYLKAKSAGGRDNWIFNLKNDTDAKEIRKCFVRIFTEHTEPPKRQTELF